MRHYLMTGLLLGSSREAREEETEEREETSSRSRTKSGGRGPPPPTLPIFPSPLARSLDPDLHSPQITVPSRTPRENPRDPGFQMGLTLLEGFSKSLAMTVLSEVGDKTFFAAAILAMRHPRRLVLSGCLGALIVMTGLSVLLGWAAPNLISRKWTHYITTILFFCFGFWSLWEGFTEEGEAEELAEVEAKLDADWKSDAPKTKTDSKVENVSKKQRRQFLTHFFSPIFLKAFSITFFGEWGDKSQIATIGLAADVNPLGVVLGGIMGQALCTTAAVLGGKSLASQISEKMVELSSGVLFIAFGIQSLLASAQG